MKLRLLSLIAIGALLAGCATSEILNNVRIGMTKDQVIAMLGKPDSMSAQSNVEYLTYYLLNTGSDFERDQPYMVRLVDGKVESFGRFRQLYDLYSRPVTSAQPGDPNFPQISGLGTTVVTPSQPLPDLAGQISRLKALKDQGVLTDAEFQKAKDKLLSDTK